MFTRGGTTTPRDALTCRSRQTGLGFPPLFLSGTVNDISLRVAKMSAAAVILFLSISEIRC